MSQITIDLSNYKETSSAYVEPGTYTVTVEDVEITKTGEKSKNPGTPMLVLNYRITDPSSPADGAVLVDRLTLSEKAMFRVVGFLTALGLPTPKKKLALNTATLLNKRLQVTVEDGQPYNGQVRSEIRGYLKVVGGTAAAAAAPATDVADLTEDDAEDEEPTTAPAEPVEEDTDESVDLDTLNLG